MQSKKQTDITEQTEASAVKQKHKKGKCRFSLHTLLALAFIIFSVITSGLLLLEVVFLEKFYYYFKIQETKNSATELLNAYGSENFEEIMRSVSFSNQICISVIDSRNYILYQSDVMGNRCLLHGWHNYLFDIQQEIKSSENGMICMNVFDEQINMKTLVLGSIIGDISNPDGYIIFNTALEPVGTTVHLLKRLLLMIALLLLCVGFIIALIVSNRLAVPIVRITESAKRMAHGNYDTEFEGQGYKEVEELAQTLTYAEHEISKVDTMQRDLIANVSHDLRTPLTMLKAYAEMIRDLSGDNPVKRNAHLQVIIEETDRLTMLVNDILDLSKLENGSQKLELSTFDVTVWMTEICSRYKGVSEQMGYHLSFTPDESKEVTCDAGKMERVVCNLINNAINYTGDDKQVFVRQINTPTGVRIEVRDTGAGIEEDKIKKIFAKYYRSENHKREVVGTGLGLSIVKAILKLHNYGYGVRSKLGEGSVFWFEIK
ncbi:MAG: HAMP domain-containing histidine kinase [Oscillospiraceae bacterium]|nr:HAMP domain-containing histidine kinase [Oscillospiraceae bacterium]